MTIIATWDGDCAQHEPFLICQECGDKLCSVEEGDEFTVLQAVVDNHATTCQAKPAGEYFVEPTGDPEDPDTRWQIINPDGLLLATYASFAKACEVAYDLNVMIPSLFGVGDPVDGLTEEDVVDA